MKNRWFIACTLLFVSIAASAQTPSQIPLPSQILAAILGDPAATGSCATLQTGTPLPVERVDFGQLSICNAQASCGENAPVSCGGNSTCSAVDRNCDAGQRGSVTCDGVTTLCPICPCDDTPVCCRCEREGDCMSCCRCGGGTFSACNAECNPF